MISLDNIEDSLFSWIFESLFQQEVCEVVFIASIFFPEFKFKLSEFKYKLKYFIIIWNYLANGIIHNCDALIIKFLRLLAVLKIVIA